mgnify:CR=1 FL=1
MALQFNTRKSTRQNQASALFDGPVYGTAFTLAAAME